ncbi:5-oxoprolinase subunit PxpA [Rheinheimera sp. YQF-2]|uniref:5-oxoprolinase subunit PxpA n=1 Tax=Rheinheimera lutimaris TaxID=2740584 RepID=A0A7Y5ARQ4_9GAMM|nr:5-oxoprolinase subunit PxpA [Rheinheimera lutimaris]NRQ42849.1 5-oxoprolinase subunit PxpA [Rheinheimera lutimaris]
MKLNCDLGESFGSWQMGLDTKVMPHIDMANIACGFHAGDADVMARTLAQAKQHGVAVGAHPSYPDLQGFGRRSMALSHSEIVNCMRYQIAALDGMALSAGAQLSYVKPHGALYNDMMAKPAVFAAVLEAVAGFYKPLQLMILATAQQQTFAEQAKAQSVALLFEAFADRRYTDEGTLTPRSQAGAVLHGDEMLSQVRQLVKHGSVTTVSGKQLALNADTLCVHGDNQAAIAQVQQIRALLA